MRFFKWFYGLLAIVTTITLTASFFTPDINHAVQIFLLLQTVAWGWICGFAIGRDM